MGEVKSYDTDEGFVIEVRLDETDPRVCDYCNKLLVLYDEKQEKLICLDDCFITDYGLMCANCKSDIPALRGFKKDEVYIDPGF